MPGAAAVIASQADQARPSIAGHVAGSKQLTLRDARRGSQPTEVRAVPGSNRTDAHGPFSQDGDGATRLRSPAPVTTGSGNAAG